MVRTRAHIGAHLMQDGGNLEQQGVVTAELVDSGQFVKEPHADVADMFAVAGVRLITLCQNPCGTQHVLMESSADLARDQ